MPTRRTPSRAVSNAHRKVAVPAAAMLGERIKRLRAEQEFSFDAFVEETGLGRGYISELERGLVVPSFTTLVRVAAALDTTVTALVATGSTSLEVLVDVARSLTDVQQKRLLQEARRLALRKKPPTPRPQPTPAKKQRRGPAL